MCIRDSTNHVREFILSEPLDDSSTIITIEGNPEGVRMEKGRRLLQIDNELVTYENYTTEPPYQFTGCVRGVFNSKAASHEMCIRDSHYSTPKRYNSC